MSSYLTPPEFIYGEPIQYVDGSKNYVRVAPVSGQTFGPGDTFKINVNSNDEILVQQKSYLKFDLALVGATTTGNTAVISALGCAAIFNRVTSYLGGVQLDDIQDYNTMLAKQYSTYPLTGKNTLKQTELYQNQAALTADASTATYGRTVCHALQVAPLNSNDKPVPVAFVAGGVTVEVELAPFSKLLASSSSGATSYQITNVQFVACMIKPSDAYILDFKKGLDAGRVAKMPISITRNYKLTPSTASSEQTLDISCGFHRSLRSVLGVQKLSTNISNVNADEFALLTNNGLKSFYFQIGSQRWPRNAVINVQNTSSSGPLSGEQAMMALCDIENDYPNMACADVTQNTEQMIFYPFASNPHFGSGEAVQDGKVILNLAYNVSPTSCTLSVFAKIDAIVNIDATNITLNTVDF